MSDRLNPELLSAYLDNEVTDAERANVERALADSPETRMEFESLKQVQARMRSVPLLTLPADFHERVLREAERRSKTQRVAAKTVAAVGAYQWMRIATIAATVAAVLVVAVVIAINRESSEIAEKPDPDGNRVAREETPLPDDNVVARLGKRPEPKYILIWDLGVTKQGQRDDVFGKTLRQAGIAFNPDDKGVVLDSKLRNRLMATRFLSDANPPNENNERFDVIDMVYLQGQDAQIFAIERQLLANQEVRLKYDLAFKVDPAIRVLNSIGDRTFWLAKSNSSKDPSSYAYRLNIGISLHSSSRSGFLAKFPSPKLEFGVLEEPDRGSNPGFTFPPLPDVVGEQPPPDNANGNAENGAMVGEIFEILVIRRNLEGRFPKDEQKLDDK